MKLQAARRIAWPLLAGGRIAIDPPLRCPPRPRPGCRTSGPVIRYAGHAIEHALQLKARKPALGQGFLPFQPEQRVCQAAADRPGRRPPQAIRIGNMSRSHSRIDNTIEDNTILRIGRRLADSRKRQSQRYFLHKRNPDAEKSMSPVFPRKTSERIGVTAPAACPFPRPDWVESCRTACCGWRSWP